ncbi:MAG: glycosyltransferase family 39 protein, partial [bacterium]|nr:glycosyltransferase family 39 protein [bacterium]
MQHAKALWLSVACCILLRLLLFGMFAPWRAEIEHASLLAADAGQYHACVLNLRTTGVYSCATEGPREPDNIWPPGFPFLAYGLFSLTGVKPWLMLLVNIGLEVLTLMAIWCICRALWSVTISAIAVWLFALNPIAITNAMGYRPDTLFQCVLALFVLVWLLYIAAPT